MAIISSVLSWLMKQRMHQIELFMKYPHEVQDELMKKLITVARHTEFGRTYDFSSIKNAQEFADRIPLQDYDSLKPYIQRLMNGEEFLLWPSPIRMFAKSSGTTSDKSKFIPVSNESLEECHYKGGKDLISVYVHNNPETLLFEGKILSLAGSHQQSTINSDAIYGDLSAILVQNLPFWIQLFRTPDRNIALMDEWEEKIELIAKQTMHENVTNLSGVPSWMLVLLNRILQISGKKNLLEVWPNLEVVVHGAVNFTPYKNQFKQLIPKDSVYYLETYNASEGFFGIQDQLRSDEMLLMLDYGIYYEFIPMSEWDNEHPKTLTLDQVNLNENYALVITTNAGLWRYKIGDTIMFTSLKPYRIKITGRTAHFINAFGEELIIDNAEKALRDACLATNSTITEYTAGPVYFNDNTAGAHEWLIEFDKPPTHIEEFSKALDHALKQYNSDYEAKRYKDKILNLPIVKVMPNKTFYNWLKSKNKLGGQHKVPRLSNNRKFIEEITAQVVLK